MAIGTYVSFLQNTADLSFSSKNTLALRNSSDYQVGTALVGNTALF